MREPAISGSHGRAYRQDLGALLEKYPELRGTTSGLVTYFLHCPTAHPYWTWWSVSLVHLRDIPGVRPANKHYPEAEYEILVMAFNPERGEPDIETLGYSFLSPPDVCEQFHGPTEEGAVEMCTTLVQACCDGLLSPDQDYRTRWKAQVRLGVEHFTVGHGPTT